jgi:hypothetical protein
MSFQYRCKSCDCFISGENEGTVVIRALMCKKCEEQLHRAEVKKDPEVQELMNKPMKLFQALSLLELKFSVSYQGKILTRSANLSCIQDQEGNEWLPESKDLFSGGYRMVY